MNTNKGKSRAGRFAAGAGLVAAGALGATVLTGVALADDTAGPDDQGTGQEQGEPGFGPGPGMRGPGGPGGFGGPMMHGEGTIRTPDGEFADVTVQHGTIDAVSDTSITVTSEDGVTGTYVIDAETRIMLDREEATAADLSAGLQVRVLADGQGDGATARVIGAHTEAFAEQMQERAEAREERMSQSPDRRHEGGPWQQGPDSQDDSAPTEG